MSKSKIVAILLLFIFLIIVAPASFASDNQTDVLGNATVASNEYYFDINVEDDTGDGSITNPYKEFTSDRIVDNSILHLSNGEYTLDFRPSGENVTIIGQDSQKTIVNAGSLNYDFSTSLALCNITFVKLSISTTGTLAADNVVFKDSARGVITSTGNRANIYLNNCGFENNYAESGAAINMNGGSLNVVDSYFIDNYAKSNGGAIYANGVEANIISSKFINNYALNEAGGAIYIFESPKFKCQNVSFDKSSSPFGGAIASISSYLNLTNVVAHSNSANYFGGFVFALYNTFTIDSSILENNSAEFGGALYVDAVEIFNIHSNRFTYNSATKAGGAVYSVLSDFFYDSIFDKALNNTFSDNTAQFENDVYESDSVNLTIGDNDYILFKYNSDFNQTLPSKYDLRDYGYVTSVKSQDNGGNCWSFSSLAALESAILKASGLSYDLSEENMKNIMAFYSDYGWSMATNNGGYDKMAVGYLTSWLGPINDSDDVYNGKSILSPVLHSFIHIQNILFLTRENYTDNDAIKRAIMDYGAVSTSVYWSSTYAKGPNYYYSGSNGANHAVAIVGWDDSYSKDKFKTVPEGDGAWIIKNSWGSNSGENGYYYVSYYDTKFAQPGKYVSYAFILNDTIKFDKNYQYDVQGKTDYFFNTTSTVWYKNKFTSSDDEYLAAVSTYFEKPSDWDLSIYVNGILKHTQSGKAQTTYSTINLDKLIPLKAGDLFEIVFKITVDGDVGVPISESVSLNQETYSKNISFISYDGKNWVDFYGLAWSYPDHTYESQVACIKAFTILNPIKTNIELRLSNRNNNTSDIVAVVLDEYGNVVNHGIVTFTFDDFSYSVAVKDGFAKYENAEIKEGINNFSAKFKEMGYEYCNNFILVSNNLIGTEIVLNISAKGNPIMITAEVRTDDGDAVKSGNVIFNVDGVNYTSGLIDGIASLPYTFKNTGLKNITVYYDDLYCYKQSSANESFIFNFHEVSISLDYDSKYNPVEIVATVVDENNDNVDMGYITFVLENSDYVVEVKEGKASLTHVFTKFGNLVAVARYSDDSYYYGSATSQKVLEISRKSTTLNFNIESLDVNNPVDLECIVKDMDNKMVDTGSVTFTIGDKTYVVEVNKGVASLKHVFKDEGINTVSAKYENNNYYAASSDEISLNVSKIKLNLNMDVESFRDTLKITVDLSEPVETYVVIYIDDTRYINKSVDGKVSLNVDGIDIGNHTVKADIYSYIYESNCEVKTVEIEPRAVDIVCESSSFNFNQTMKCSVSINDVFGFAVVNYPVKMTLNGKTYSAKTDSSGTALFEFSCPVGSYNIDIIFDGDEKYLKNSLNQKITVKSSITLPSVAKYTYNSDYKVVLYDGNGNLLKNKQVKVIVDNVEYNASTDSNGVLNYNLNLGVGNHVISVKNIETGESKSQSISVVKRIDSNKAITMYYGAGTSYTVRVLDDNGNIAKNVEVTFTIAGKTYSRYTNSNGYASLKISFQPKTYTIVAEYKGFKVSNKIVVKPTLILKDKTVKKSKTFKYNVKLLNSKGKILKNKKVTVKFRGKTYKVKTSSKGIATFKIKALSKTGKFTLTASYGSAKISKKITVKK